MEESRILNPDTEGAYQSDDFGEPRFLHFPIHSKGLNSLIKFKVHSTDVHQDLNMNTVVPLCLALFFMAFLMTYRHEGKCCKDSTSN